MQVIGFIGAGVMGAPMIANLVRAGNDVIAFGHSERSRQRAATAGARLVDTIAEVASAAVVITMLPDTPDVDEVVLGEEGLLAHLEPGSLLIDMSTISADFSRTMAAALANRGVDFLDSPVSGGEAAAVEGTLSVMVGGTAAALDRATPVLKALAGTVTHVGPTGAGQAVKAANQLIVAMNLQAIAEAVVLLEHSGVDVEAGLDAISGGLAGSTALTRKRHAIRTNDFTAGFRLRLHRKDLSLVRETTRSAGLVLPGTALVTELVETLVDTGSGDLDHSALLQLARTHNPRSAADHNGLQKGDS